MLGGTLSFPSKPFLPSHLDLTHLHIGLGKQVSLKNWLLKIKTTDGGGGVNRVLGRELLRGKGWTFW